MFQDLHLDLVAKKEASGEVFGLDVGWTLLGFPMVPSEVTQRTARGLIHEINSQGYGVTQIGKYTNGTWSMYTFRQDEGQGYGDDFEIVETGACRSPVQSLISYVTAFFDLTIKNKII